MTSGNRFNIVHYVPNLFLGGGIPVAAVLLREAHAPSLVRAEFHPDFQCLGGREHAIALEHLMRRLERNTAACLEERLLGPHVRIDGPRPVPSDVDPVEWLRRHVLPRPPSETGKRGPRRATYGYSWLDRHGLSSYVRKQFRADKLRNPHIFRISEPSLKPVSHWVEGVDNLLLMEPILPAASKESLLAVLSEVTTVFSAYRYQSQDNGRVHLAAYVLDGGPPLHRELAMAHLRSSAHRVFDLASDESALEFVQRVRQVGSEGAMLH